MKKFIIRKEILERQSELIKQKIQMDKGGEVNHKKEYVPEKFMLENVSQPS